MTQEGIKILNRMLIQYENEFNKYFSDLLNVIQGIITYSQVPLRIKAHFKIRPLVDDLYKKNINLLHGFTNFYYSVIEIYDFLKERFPYDFPKRFNRSLSEKYEKQEYVNIVGQKIKLYTIEHIYNGIYFIDGRGRCPKCYEEGLLINTDSVRSTSLEYHHNTEKKESEYSAIKMFQMYQKSRSDPLFLEKLIKKMELDKVVLMCRVHHQMKHSKYFNYFKYLINGKDIFSLPTQLIYILIRISVNNHYETKNASRDKKRSARNSIISFLKKRYILEQVCLEKCPICQEFNIKEHLPAFDFNHIFEHNFRENPHIQQNHDYINSVAQLFYKNYTCSEIAKALDFERGGFLCKNCHNVIDYSSIYLHLLEEIYEDEDIVAGIINDHKLVKMRFILFRYKESTGDPIKKNREINDSYERYLDAFYKLTQKGHEITHDSLADYLGIKRHSVFQYLKKNKSFFKDFIEVNIGLGHGHNPTEVFLTERGKEYIELMYYIRDYYKSLKC
ncbi:hypothetical protein ES705_07074 [subsurface metagenome]